jgi:hypothetical protein
MPKRSSSKGRTVIVFGNDDATIRIWDLTSGAPLRTIEVGAPVYRIILWAPAWANRYAPAPGLGIAQPLHVCRWLVTTARKTRFGETDRRFALAACVSVATLASEVYP